MLIRNPDLISNWMSYRKTMRHLLMVMVYVESGASHDGSGCGHTSRFVSSIVLFYHESLPD